MFYVCCHFLLRSDLLTIKSLAYSTYLMIMSGILIVTCRYLEGYFSHAGSYELLAKMRVDMFGTLRKLAPGSLIGRNNGDIMAIAIADIESIEFFFAHTIGPLFTVILLPLVTLIIAGSIDMLFVYALLPIYLIISVIIPILAIKLGRNIGIGYRQKVRRIKNIFI